MSRHDRKATLQATKDRIVRLAAEGMENHEIARVVGRSRPLVTQVLKESEKAKEGYFNPNDVIYDYITG